MPPVLEPTEDHRALLLELGRLAAFTPPEVAATFEGTRSGWSVGQHLEHIFRADELNLRAIEAIVSGRDDSDAPPLSETAVEILSSGNIPRGVAGAPEAVNPPEIPDLYGLEELRQVQIRRWQTFDPSTVRATAPDGRVGHPLLGAFGVAEWIRFAAIHTRHHRSIIEEIAGTR